MWVFRPSGWLAGALTLGEAPGDSLFIIIVNNAMSDRSTHGRRCLKVTTWILSGKAGRRFYAGHPWVFANELTASPKGVAPGGPVELRDERGQILARGYGNPHSLIAFRTLSRRAQDLEPWKSEALTEQVVRAAQYRHQLGLKPYSHRLLFGEADDLPGLVIDRFVDSELQGQVLVLQMLTAGIESALGDPREWVRGWCERATGVAAERTTVVVRRDVGSRKLEGLELQEPQVIPLGSQSPSLAEPFRARMRSGDGTGAIPFNVELVGGQKTGFFFDQASNVELLLHYLLRSTTQDLRVLDLFCYVGQWGAQIAQALKNQGRGCEVHLADASDSALMLAKQNVLPWTERVNTHAIDIVEGLGTLPECDVVICDPPAFIKSKKDHGAGLRGYLKVNAAALEKVSRGGLVVSCSCSHHLSDDDMIEVLQKAEQRSGRRVRWLARGCQAPDHPIRLNFPEGRYLKAWLGQVE